VPKFRLCITFPYLISKAKVHVFYEYPKLVCTLLGGILEREMCLWAISKYFGD
jgi:hypothetical protein